ncbi:MAG: hypothetical protein RIF36_17925 [Imperialibacter sp.]|uniref:hypothetical protein n=1 Tax=Imperialibacter sp. TaxID=2038411 RepID=UPI0032EDEDC9
MRYFFLLIVLSFPLLAVSQSSRDTVFLKERTMDRPLIVHDHQLRVTGLYGFSTITKKFDESSGRIKLSDEGSSNMLHRGSVDIRYGFLNILQVNVALTYVNNYQRAQPILSFALDGSYVETYYNSYYSGFQDLFIGGSILAPWKTRKIDLVLSGGMTLPTANSMMPQPGHTYEQGAGSTKITYNRNYPVGLGVAKTYVGTQFKYRLKNMAFTASLRYGFPMGESEDVDWRYRVVLNEFSYERHTYRLAHPSSYSALLEVEYQLFPFVNVFLDLAQDAFIGGWSERTTVKTGFPDRKFTILSPGIEVLLTSKFWLRQQAIFGIAGQNTLAPFSINTSLMYNFFPF